MSYQLEIDPSLTANFPLERERLFRLRAGIGALFIARRHMPEEPQFAKIEIAPEPEVIKMPVQPTASDNLAEIRAQVEKSREEA